MKQLLILVISFVVATTTSAQIITTVAGNGTSGYTGDGGAATGAEITAAYYVTTDNFGNFYIASGVGTVSNVRKVDAYGIITDFAGNGIPGYSGDGGPATAAEINAPYGICSDPSGNIYICDYNNCRIRKVNTSGIISTFAGTGSFGYSGDGGPATAAQIGYPRGLVSDAYGNIYYSDFYSYRIRKIDASTGIITTFVGSGTYGIGGDGGPATACTIAEPEFLACDAASNLYFSDVYANRIRKVTISTGIINTIAGTGALGFEGDGGPATAASFRFPTGIAVDGPGNVYISDINNDRVRKVDTSGIITTIAGSGTGGFSGDGGPALLAKMMLIEGLAVDSTQNLFICDFFNRRVRKVNERNRAPYFNNGHNINMTVCENTVGDSINSMLAIYDSDIYQTETWSLVTSASHGTAVCANTATSTDSTVRAANMYYTPTAGYTGSDSFRVRIFDGQASDTTTIHVHIIGPGAITGATHICAGATLALGDTTTAGVWSSGSSSVAGLGSTGIVTGLSSGIAMISYTSPGSGCSATAIVTINPLPPAFYGIMHVCMGATTSLTDSITGGTWASATTAVTTIGSLSGIATGISTGTSVVTYTTTAGCTRTGIMTVNALPSLIAGPAMVCAGSAITLADTIAGGVWSVPGGATIGSTGILTGATAGTAVVTYTLPSGCSVTKAISVNPVPSGMSGSTYVCAGATAPIYESGSGVWMSSTPSVATIGSSSGIAYGISGGITTISYINSSGCVATMPFTVVATPPAITGFTHACVGSVTALSDSVTGGTWTSSDYSVAYFYSSDSMTGVSSGIATVSYTAPSGCSSTIVVTINAAPTAITGLFGLCTGSTTTLHDGVSGGAWASSDITKATIDTSAGIVIGVAAGSVTITYATGPGCSVTQGITIYAAPAAIGGTLTVCQGSTTSLSDATTGGVWSPATGATAYTGSTGTVTGVAAGTTTISYTTGTGCTATAIVTVNPLPASIGGSSGVCTGATITLTDGTTGGTWSATGAATTGSTGIVTGTATGTATIAYTLGTGCAASKLITVNPLPGAISGPASVCVGQSITLADGGTGTWGRSNANVSVGSASGVVTGVTTGTDVITYTLTATGCYATQAITVNTTAGTITGTTNVCVGATTALADGTGTWSIAPGTVAGIGSATGVVTGILSGTATVTYVAGSGCTATTIITVNPLPLAITGTGAICPGATLTLADGTTGGTWSTGSSAATVTGGTVTGTTTGTALISYTLATGCRQTATVTVNVLPGAIGGAGAVCRGASITLSDGIGTWTSSNVAKATIGSATGIVTAVDTGITTITFTNTSGCIATKTITVSSTPVAITGADHVCTGDSITLTDAIGGGVWSSTIAATAGSLSGVITGVSAGVATITYSLGTGCTVTKAVTVNASPNVITGSRGICVGSTTTLADATTGGTWSSTPTTTATITGSTVSGVAAGTAVIDYTIAGTGCYANTTVTVNNTPTAITGPATVCTGATITETEAVAGGTWTTTSTSIATVGSTGSVTGITAGTATITCSIGSCAVSRAITVASVSPITGAMGICRGNTTSLSDATTGGTWSSAPATVATVGTTTGTVTGVSIGMAVIDYTSAAGCVATTTVSINAAPGTISGTLRVCAGSTTTLGNSAGGGAWSTTGTGITIGSTTGIVTGVTTGTAAVTYSLGTGCTATTTVTVSAPTAAIRGTMAMCAGSAITLTDSTAGGTWSTTATTARAGSSTGIVTGITAGTATISYSAGGCVATAIVTVNALPDNITGTTSVCEGMTTTLSDLTTGGTWSSTGTATVDSTGIVTATTAGTTMISYTLATGCATDITVTVNAAPPAIGGFTSMCIGSSTALSDGRAGGTWSIAPTTTGTISSAGVVYGASLGTATVSYMAGGCAATTTVTVNSLPAAISGNNTVCAGMTDTLTDLPGGGLWSVTGSHAGISSAGVLTGVSAGTGTVSYSLGVGCTVGMTITVTASPAAITGSTEVCAGGTITLHDATTGGAWSSGNNAIGTINTSGVVTGITNGTALMNYTSIATGCAVVYGVAVIKVPDILGPDTVCASGSTIMERDTLAGGSWTSSLVTVSPSGLVTSFGPGTGVVTYTMPAGCAASKSIVVDPLPGVIHGSAELCAGTSTTLTDTSHGIWSMLPTAAATISSAGVVTAIAAGEATVSYTIGTGCAQVVVVTVDIAPATAGVITGDSSVCAGSTMTLNDTAGSGVWSTTGVIATIGATGIVTGHHAGSQLITYTVTNRCGTIATGKMVTVNATVVPTISIVAANTTLCAGAMASFTSTTTNGGTPGYIWEVNGSTMAGATTNNYSYIPANGDEITAVLSSTAMCASPAVVTSNTVTMTVDAQVVPSVTITATPGNVILAGTDVVFTATTTNGGATPTYQWEKNGIVIPGATNSTYSSTSLTTGDTIVCVVISSGLCGGNSSASNKVGIELYNNVGVTSPRSSPKERELFPNPTTGLVTVTNAKGCELVVYDVVGREVLRGNVISDKQTVDISSLANGVYSVGIIDPVTKERTTRKVIKGIAR